MKLILESPATVAELAAEFGERSAWFSMPTAGLPHEVTLIAGLKGDAVVDVVLRRDLRPSFVVLRGTIRV